MVGILSSMARWLLVAAVCLAMTVDAKRRDFYKILNVSRSATVRDIKKAYKTLATELHPDRNPDADPSLYQEVNDAYTILKDKKKREVYDRVGEEGLQKHEQQQQQRQGGGGFFNGFFGGRGQQEPDNTVPTGPNVEMKLYVTLEQLYSGTIVPVTRVKGEPKETSGTRNCKCRQVRQRVQMAPGFFTETMRDECEQCPNIKFVPTATQLDIDVPEGAPEGHRITFFSEGDPHIDGINGDLFFFVESVEHDIFTRRGDDLFANITISLEQSLNGFELEFPHLDDHSFTLRRLQVTPPNHVQKVVGEGLPVYDVFGHHGDLYLTYTVAFPTGVLSSDAKDQVTKYFPNQADATLFNGLGK